MLTFGYKNKFSSILRACAAIGIGLVMIFSNDATANVVRIIAAFLFSVGVISYVHAKKTMDPGMPVILVSLNSVADIVLGLLLYFFPDSIANFIVFLVGIGILIFGIMQVIVLFGTLSLLGSGFLSMALSSAAILCGIVLVFNPFSKEIMSFIAGCALVFYGVSELMSAWRVEKANKLGEDTKVEATVVNEPFRTDSASGISTSGISDAKEVEYEKEEDIDEQ